MKSFKNKVAVITGAASGIGRALAIALADKGAKLAISDLNKEGLKETKEFCTRKGAEVLSTHTDVSKLDQVQELVKAVMEEYGAVHLVFNNAGIALGKKTLVELSYEEWEKIMAINLWGVIYGSKEFLPHLLKQEEAAIINISSVFGLAGIAEQTPYCTTKFAVRGFTESLRMELIGTNVKTYCVHPGGINTNIANLAVEEAAADPQKKIEVENFKKMLIHPPEKAAKVILEAIRKDDGKILIGQEAYVFDLATRLLPVNYSRLMDFGTKKILKT